MQELVELFQCARYPEEEIERKSQIRVGSVGEVVQDQVDGHPHRPEQQAGDGQQEE